jgi:Ni/Fe-hydrogenase subunit HybB-like protein
VLAIAGATMGDVLAWTLRIGTAVAAALSACYTGWLFGQARGRVLWMRRGLWLHLIVQALAAGAALLVLAAPFLGFALESTQLVARVLAGTLVVHLAFVLLEPRCAPRNREAEYERVHALVAHGPFAMRHWALGVVAGILVPIVVVLVPGLGGLAPVAALLALAGLWIEEDVLVRAGQALPIS